MSAYRVSSWKWHEKGFLYPPTAVLLTLPVRLFRAWGGTSKEEAGSDSDGMFLSFDRPSSRREAEALFAVFEWGNSCEFLTTFKVIAGTVIHVGDVHPGDRRAHVGTVAGSQVFIERSQIKGRVTIDGPRITLVNDMNGKVVIGNKEPPKNRWS